MTPKDIRNMASMVRAIRAGKWTNELPAWYLPSITMRHSLVLQEIEGEAPAEIRAVQTAEAFILVAHASGTPFDEGKFLRACGFVG